MKENDAGDAQSKDSTLGLSRRTFLAGAAGTVAMAGLGAGAGFAREDGGMTEETTMAGEATAFTVRIENASKHNTLMTSGSGERKNQPVPLSPGVWAVHADPGVLFTAGEPDYGDGLERIAEDADPSTLAESLSGNMAVKSSGAFTTPVDAMEAGPILPGDAFEFRVEATPGDRLSFATMFGPSNDLFYAPDDRGLALFDGDEPLSGDVTNAIDLWDAGTEENEEPGVGPNQVQRQSGPDTGETEDGVVRLVAETNDGYDYPYISDVIRVTLHAGTM